VKETELIKNFFRFIWNEYGKQLWYENLMIHCFWIVCILKLWNCLFNFKTIWKFNLFIFPFSFLFRFHPFFISPKLLKYFTHFTHFNYFIIIKQNHPKWDVCNAKEKERVSVQLSPLSKEEVQGGFLIPPRLLLIWSSPWQRKVCPLHKLVLSSEIKKQFPVSSSLLVKKSSGFSEKVVQLM